MAPKPTFEDKDLFIKGLDSLPAITDEEGNEIQPSIDELALAARSNAFDQLQDMSRADRMEVLTLLWRKGFGGESKPEGGGLRNSDVETFANFLLFQKGEKTLIDGKLPTAQQTYSALDKTMKDVATGQSKRAITYTNKMDVTSVFNQVAQRDLGRKPTEKELDRFFEAYHSLESKVTTTDQAPSIGAAAESQLKQANTGEVKATSFAGYAQAFQDMLRGA